MQESQAIIERVKRVSATIQRLDVAVDRLHQSAGAGQTFSPHDPLARSLSARTLDFVQREASCLVFERSAGTIYTPGQVVSLIGPIGKPIPLRENIRTLLLIAHEFAPMSLLFLAQTALAKGIAVTLVLGGLPSIIR